jgi:3-hydroxyisobutyrate dehydrogenase-like beta-hydroxyacid dehydrogenase
VIIHLGDVGAGQTAKLINNSLMAANLGLAHGAMTLGVEQGLDRQALVQLLNASSSRSYALQVYTRMRDAGAFAHSSTLLNKVRLLGEAVGHDNPAVRALRDAATALHGA